MDKTARQRKQTAMKPVSVSWLTAFISGNATKVVAACGTAIIGTVGFWISPLKDKLFHVFYHENAVILLSADTLAPIEGGLFRLRIVLMPGSAIHVDKGYLEVTFDRAALALRSKQASFDTPLVDSPLPIPDENGIEFLALHPGNTVVGVNLRTRNGTYHVTTPIEIMPASASEEAATITTFTGSWLLKLGSSQGKMTLQQQDWQTIPGSYFLDNGEKGLVYAHHDGRTLGAIFIRGNSSPTRWYVDETPYAANDGGYLESTGIAQLQRASPTGWASTGTIVHFYAAIKLR
jgi:hypothetical protein